MVDETNEAAATGANAADNTDEVMNSPMVKMEMARAFLGGAPGDAPGGHDDGAVGLSKTHLVFVPRGQKLLVGSMKLVATLISLIVLVALAGGLASLLGLGGFILGLIIYYAIWKTFLKGAVHAILARSFDVKKQMQSEHGRAIARADITKVEKGTVKENGPHFMSVHFRRGDAKDTVSFIFGPFGGSGYGTEKSVDEFMAAINAAPEDAAAKKE